MSDASVAGVPEEGDVVAGKYRVERVLGVGGMGVVVAAQHIRLDEKVALKFLLPEATRNRDAVARFEREARAASKIKSEHVARVSDVGTLESGAPYMVMEYLEGTDLSGLLEKHGALPVHQAVDFVLQACEALAEAHSLGIVHRDLKPANLFCIRRADGQLCIKVLDFGISKLTAPGSEAAGMTRTTAIMGSPLYMSPEQIRTSKGVDVRTDVWSLGVILFELVTRSLPFYAESMTELIVKIAVEPATPFRPLRPDAPPGFEHVLARCLEKNRDLRFQTVADLALALADYAPPQSRLSIDRVVGTLQRSGVSFAPQGRASQPSQPQMEGIPVSGGFGGGAMSQPAPVAGRQTGASWGQTAPGTQPRARSYAGLAAGVAVAVLGAVAIAGVLIARDHTASEKALTAASAPPAAATTASPPPSAATTASARAPEAPATTAPSAPPAAAPATASPEVPPAPPADPPVAAPETQRPHTAPSHHAAAPPAARPHAPTIDPSSVR